MIFNSADAPQEVVDAGFLPLGRGRALNAGDVLASSPSNQSIDEDDLSEGEILDGNPGPDPASPPPLPAHTYVTCSDTCPGLPVYSKNATNSKEAAGGMIGKTFCCFRAEFLLELLALLPNNLPC